MRKLLSAAITAGATSALVAALAVSPAAATTTTWTVTPGGAFISTIARPTALQDIHFGGKRYACQPIKMTGAFHSGSGLANPIGQIASVRGPKARTILCAIPGSAFLMTVTHFPMGISAFHYDAATGVTHGVITGIHINLSTAPGGPGPCTGTIDGTGPNAHNGKVPFTYANSGGELDFSGNHINLTAYNVTGCRGQIHNGDNFVWQVMAFPRTMAGTANTITSP